MTNQTDAQVKLLPALTATRNNGNGAKADSNGRYAPNGHKSTPKEDAFTLAPHSAEAEEAVIGSVLMNPACLFDVCRILDADDFFILRHDWIWEEITRLHESKTPLDTRTLAEALRVRDRLDYIGGEAYLRYLPTVTISTLKKNVVAYAEIVKRGATRRRLLGAAGEIAQLAYNEELDIFQVLAECQDKVTAISQESTARQSNGISAYDLASDFLDTLADWREGKKEIGIGTPWPDFNQMTGGFLRGDLIIVAGPTSMGKSAWMIQAALHAAFNGYKVWFGSNEMNRQQIFARMAAIKSGVSTHYNNIRQTAPEDYAKVVAAVADISQLPIHFEDIRGCTAVQVRDRVREQYQTDGVDIAFVDYLQNHPDPGTSQRHDLYLKNCALTYHQLAGALNIPVVLASQLSGKLFERTSRGADKYKVKRPRLGDLYGSSGVGQTAETVVFLHRDGYWREKEEGLQPQDRKAADYLTDGIIAKQRNGPTGDWPMIWRDTITRFDSPAKKQDEEKASEVSHYANEL